MDKNKNIIIKILIDYNLKRHQKKNFQMQKGNKVCVLTKNLKNKKLNKELDTKKLNHFW